MPSQSRNSEERRALCLAEVKAEGKKAVGGKELIKYLEGESLTPRQIIIAKCYDCMGYYIDGRVDCECPLCPCYPFMPQSSKPQAKRAVNPDRPIPTFGRKPAKKK